MKKGFFAVSRITPCNNLQQGAVLVKKNTDMGLFQTDVEARKD